MEFVYSVNVSMTLQTQASVLILTRGLFVKLSFIAHMTRIDALSPYRSVTVTRNDVEILEIRSKDENKNVPFSII
jgi:hypothetical protein